MVETLGDRIVPSVTYFTYNDGSNDTGGYVDYDDADVDAASATQALDLMDGRLTFQGVDYEMADIDSGAVVNFAYGRVSGFDFYVTTPPSGGTPLHATHASGHLYLAYGASFPPVSISPLSTITLDGPPAELDTSDTDAGSGFSFTLSDGTRGTGDFTLLSSAVVSTGSVSLTGFTLNIAGEPFDINDCDSTPTADFSSGVFTGITFSLSSLGTTGIDSIVGSGGLITATISSVSQVRPNRFDNNILTVDLDTLTVGQGYYMNVKFSYVDGGATTTVYVTVAAGNNRTDITDNFIKALTKEGMFFTRLANNKVELGGNLVQNRALAKVEFTLWQTDDPVTHEPIPSNTLSRPAHFGGRGTVPVLKVNGTTINP